MNTFNALTPGSVAIILVGVAFLGGAIGSFLNVVIYRLPAGLSLIHPPSRCPKCEHPIRAYDNIPVLGWILLRGKCRDCGEPISARYPTIEAIVMLTFLLVAWLEWFGPMYSYLLPYQDFQESDWTLAFVPSLGTLVARVGMHLMLLTTLLGVGMIQWDGKRVPDWIWVPVIVASVSCLVALLDIAICPVSRDGKPMREIGLINGLVGVAVGTAVGSVFWGISLCLPKKRRTSSTAKREGGTLALSFLCVGLVFGWQVVVGIGAVYLPVLIVASLLKRSLPAGLCLFVLSLASIVLLSFVPF